ncbi:DMT family transporter [Acanthopleuribacter pedis]|uniref:DMT family transporter n=1 Tax=Acanthopleuribacter pedis TaxID=442870 RepID=A0A8J7U7X9_9BACT|nr:DMT family transporter [Acanthopleuribacter pedis]MBO1321876.1 DMT family transporter [Acanthopleuribacter pedis]
MSWKISLMVLLTGTLIPIQAGVNGALARKTGSPMFAATVSFLIGTVFLLAIIPMVSGAIPKMADVRETPWWVWSGGLVGAAYVVLVIMAVQKVGASTLIVFVVAGQMIASLIIDHYGLIGFPQVEITVKRMAGALLLIGGVLMIRSS